MSDDGYPRSSWDPPDQFQQQQAHHHAAPSPHPRIPMTMQHYVPSSESLNHSTDAHPHPHDDGDGGHSAHGHGHGHHNGVYGTDPGQRPPPTPTKAPRSGSPPRGSSADLAVHPNGSGSARWGADGGGPSMSDLGHARPRPSLESEGAGRSDGHGMGMAMGEGESREGGEREFEHEHGHGHGHGHGPEEEAASTADVATLVEPSFDENVLRALRDSDVSDPLPPLSFRSFGAARGVLTACPVSSAFPVVFTGLVRDPLLTCADMHRVRTCARTAPRRDAPPGSAAYPSF